MCLPRTLVFTNMNPGTVCGYSYRCLFATLFYVLQTNRTLFLEQFNDDQHHPDFTTWDEFFLPLTRPDCVRPQLAQRTTIVQTELLEKYNNVQHVQYDGCACPINRNDFDVQKYFNPEWMAKASDIIFRMNNTTKSKVMKLVFQEYPNFLKIPYNAIHIRRGDKMLDASPVATEKYCQAVSPNLPLFIVGDSMTSVEDGIKECNKTFKVIHYFKGPEYIAARAGNFSMANNWQASHDLKALKFTMFLAELVIMTNAHTFVGTGTSNVWQMVAALRANKNTITLDKKRHMK